MKLIPQGGNVLPLAGVILLYPGFYFYHSAVALLGIPPFLGGYYGAVTGGLIVPLLMLQIYRFRISSAGLSAYDITFLALLLFICAWALIYRSWGSQMQADPALLWQSASGAGLWLVNYLLFRNLDLESRWLGSLMLVAFIVMMLIALLNQEGGFFNARQLSAGSEESVATYQGFARSAFVTALILLGSLRLQWIPWVFVSGVGLLFMLGARSEFAVFFPVGVLAIYLRAGPSRFLLFMAPVLIVGLLMLADTALSEAGDSRILRLFDLQFDSSYQQRLDSSEFALDAIINSPILGEYGSHVLAGGLGSYAHNGLSAWANYGIIGFLIFVFLLLKPVLDYWLSYVRRKREDRLGPISSLLFNSCSILMAIFAKSVFYPGFAIGWGIYANVMDAKKNRSKERGRNK